MELKTDKIHRILNTPYDELSPQDFAVAQEQLDVLVVGTRDKQIDAFQFIENKLVCERDEALKRVSQLTAQLFILQQKPSADEALQERDQFKGICERLKRELDEAKSDILGAQMTTRREYDGVRDDLYKARVRITDLETQLRDERGRATGFEVQAQALLEDRDRLSAELDDERQKPSGTAKQAARIRELEDTLREERAALKSQCERSAATMADGVRLIFERDAIKAELEQAKVQAANASAMVVSIATERDAAQQRELKALRQLADLVERTSKPTIFEYPAPGSAGRNVGSASEFAKLADEEVAAAHEALDKREAELDKHGYGRAPGTPPAKVVGLYDHQCAMPTPDGPCTARPTGRNNGFPFCSRHLDAIRDGMRREHEQAAMSRVNAAIAAGKADPLAASIDGGQTWWCPQCQSSIIPDVPHVCPEPFDAFAKLSPEERALIRSLPDEQPE